MVLVEIGIVKRGPNEISQAVLILPKDDRLSTIVVVAYANIGEK